MNTEWILTITVVALSIALPVVTLIKEKYNDAKQDAVNQQLITDLGEAKDEVLRLSKKIDGANATVIQMLADGAISQRAAQKIQSKLAELQPAGATGGAGSIDARSR